MKYCSDNNIPFPHIEFNRIGPDHNLIHISSITIPFNGKNYNFQICDKLKKKTEQFIYVKAAVKFDLLSKELVKQEKEIWVYYNYYRIILIKMMKFYLIYK